jgi:HAE1 family hydrophobic/amphiphilic exporter-1
VNFSELWIRRPVMTILVMTAILFFGLISYNSLPINNLPAVEFPTISVSASLPGASPETMATTVAKPLEKQFATIAGLEAMSSVNSLGQTQITLQFSLQRHVDDCAQDVNAKIAAARGELPTEMPTPPTYDKFNPSDWPIIYFALTSDTLPLNTINTYADTLLSQNFSTVYGVGQVQNLAPQKYAVRIQLNPKALANRGIGIDDVGNAIRTANVNLPQGTLDGSYQRFTVDSKGQLLTADPYRSLIVAYQNGYPVRVGDIGTALDSVQEDRVAAWYLTKGKTREAIVLAIKKQPGANTVKVSDDVKALIPKLKTMLPQAIEWDILYDQATYIRDSIEDVQFTLVITILLVVVVIFLFLRSIKPTIIPSIAVPLSLIATFAVMNLLGYSKNNLSLMALVLSVGFVVDDAIVMLENIVRHQEMGEKPMTASLNGSREIGFTIISMTLSLVVVFIPILFMPDVVGRLFREFAVCIAVAILISGFISITLTPMMCSRILKSSGKEKGKNRFHAASERVFDRALALYGRGLTWSLDHRGFVLLFTAVIITGTIYLFKVMPAGFLPSQDQNFFQAFTQAPDRISFDDLVKHQTAVHNIVRDDPDVVQALSVVGYPNSNNGVIFANLSDLKKRGERPVDKLLQELRPKVNAVPGIVTFLQNPPPIAIGATSSLALYQYTLQSSNLDELYRYTDILEGKMKSIPGLVDVNSDIKLSNPKLEIIIDRDKASALGLSLQQIQDTFFSAYARRKISTIYTSTDAFYVILEVEPQYRMDPSALSMMYVKSNTGKLVQLDTIATISQGVGPLTVNHVGQLPGSTIAFNLERNHSIGDAVAAINNAAKEANVPHAIGRSFQGSAQAFQKSFASMGYLLIVTVLIIYIVLGILYESFIHPITILSALPLAGFGALLSLWIFGMELDMYAYVGIIMLIGIVKKNGIMMVDFAVEAERTEKLTSTESIHKACMVRFRPIMMTTMAALFGTLPIAVGWGAGGDARQPMGVAVVGGLFFSQLMTLFVTPVFYVYFDRINKWMLKEGREEDRDSPGLKAADSR